MEIRAVATLAALTALTFAGCTASGEPFDVAAPAWKPGYTWSIDEEHQYESETTFNGERDNDTWDDSEHYVLQVLNTTASVDGVPVYLAAAQRDDRYSMLQAFRRPDLAQMPLESSITNQCIDGECTGDIDLGLWHDDVAVAFDFPLRPGKAWAHSFEEEGAGFHLEARSKAVKSATIETAMGEASAILVKRAVFLNDVDAALDQLRHEIEAEGGEVHALRGDYRVTVTEHYAPDYMFPVLSVTEMLSDFHLRATIDGQEIDATEHFEGTSRREVVGASFQAGPERSIPQIAGLLGQRAPIPDPAGEAVQPAVDYTLSIVDEVAEVNAMEGGQARFRAAIDGEMPSDHALQWQAVASGATVTGQGTTFEPAFEHPGTYQVTVQAMAGNDAVASAASQAVAHWRGTVTLTCGAVEVAGNGVPDDCATVTLPLHPGIKTASFQAAHSSPGDAAQSGSLQAISPDGFTVDASSYGAGDDWTWDDVSSYPLDERAWGLDYRQTVGLLNEVAVAVDLTYGDDVPTGVAKVQVGELGMWLPQLGPRAQGFL